MENDSIALPQERRIELGGVPYQFYDVGKGPMTVVILHAIMSNKKWALHLIRLFQQRYRCIALDLPGHNGISIDGYTDIEDMATYVKGFIHHMALNNVVILGFSLGGVVAYTVESLYRDESWLKGIIVWASPVMGSAGLTKLVRVAMALLDIPVLVRICMRNRSMLSRLLTLIRMRPSEEEITVISEFPLSSAQVIMKMIDNSSSNVCPHVPALYIFDPKEKLVSNKNIPYMQTHGNSNCSVSVVEGGGHFGTKKGIRSTYSLFGTFLARLEKVD